MAISTHWPINFSTEQHVVSQRVGIDNSSRNTAPAVLSGELSVPRRGLGSKEIKEAHVWLQEHRELMVALEHLSNFLFFSPDRTPEISKWFKIYGTSTYQWLPFLDKHDKNTYIRSISSVDEIVTSVPEAVMNSTSSQHRQTEWYKTKGYKPKAVKKRKISVAEMAVVELEAERRTPSSFPHKDDDHIMMGHNHEQRKIAGS